MIGYSIVAIQTGEDSFIGVKGDCYFGIWLRMHRRDSFDEKKHAAKLYNDILAVKKGKIKLTLNDLKEISKATSCIEGHGIYHKYACDCLYVIPMDKSGYVNIKDFLKKEE